MPKAAQWLINNPVCSHRHDIPIRCGYRLDFHSANICSVSLCFYLILSDGQERTSCHRTISSNVFGQKRNCRCIVWRCRSGKCHVWWPIGRRLHSTLTCTCGHEADTIKTPFSFLSSQILTIKRSKSEPRLSPVGILTDHWFCFLFAFTWNKEQDA